MLQAFLTKAIWPVIFVTFSGPRLESSGGCSAKTSGSIATAAA
jgi:hypothetical protein